MKPIRLDRRQALRGAGAVIGLPLLEAMLPQRASAAGPVMTTKRFITIVTPDGTLPDFFFPTGGETDFKLGDITAPLEKYRKDLLIFKGIDNKAASASPGGGHGTGMATLLSGRRTVGAAERNLSGGATLDQEIAVRWAGDPATRTPFRSLELGSTASGGTYGTISYSGPGMPLPKTNTGKKLFDRVFAGGSPDAERLRQRRASLLDRVLGDYKKLQAKLGKDDRERVEKHIGALREVELRFTTAVNCAAPGITPGTSSDDAKKLPEIWQEMLAVLVPTLACDVTRVMTYMFRTEGANQAHTFGWLGIGPEGNLYGIDGRDDKNGTSHHTMSHYDYTPENKARLTTVNRWYMEQIVMLADRLKATPDGPGGRTLWDSTTILYGSAIGKGNHTLKNIPCFLLGNAGGYFKTGRFLTYNSASHTELLTSVNQAMGAKEDEVFGDPMFAKGPLANLRG